VLAAVEEVVREAMMWTQRSRRRRRTWLGRQRCGPDDGRGVAEKKTSVGGGGAFTIHRCSGDGGVDEEFAVWTQRWRSWPGGWGGGDGRVVGEVAVWI
jgi:hypothetical protein